ncbi:MAG: Gfo/Idh/MocA family oxidoreductase [Clostridia bacterium]|nr:Gfo/Idh/MocA family oxidoreductase [Clostridia bacterium]
MKKLKIGVIGAGGICTACHMPAFAEMDNVEIVAICDIKVQKAQALADKYGIPNVFEDYNDVISMDGIDAIDICTPNYLHSIIAVAALNKGLHVFCEKPDAVNVEEASKMKAASEASGKVLMVMRNNRFTPASEFLKKYIEDGKMGEIYAARCGWQRRRGIPGKGGWFTTKQQSGGGPLIDLGVHMIDLAIWLMGNPKPVAVSGSTYTKFANAKDASDSIHSIFGETKEDGTFDVEDLAMGFIKFDNGACMQIEFSWASNIEKENRFVELRGTNAGTTLNFSDSNPKIFTTEFDRIVDIEPKLPTEGLQQHAANIHHFADVVLNGAKPDFIPEQGVDMIKILTAIYKSAETGREVLLND